MNTIITGKAKGYMPQLDALRAIAVILVIISHWFSKTHFLNRFTPNGMMGVTLFFVLSGFLITGILLRSKSGIDEGKSVAQAFKVFYIRRALRIFPVYYLLLLILVTFNIAAIRESFWWHFFYASNFHFWLQDAWAGQLSHFWSLAVEEQFYLVWPAVIFFTPTRLIPHALLSGILIAVLFRYLVVTPHDEMGRLLMPGSLDSFCIGGLFAFGRLSKPGWFRRYYTNRTKFVAGAFVLLVLVHLHFFAGLRLDVHRTFYLFLLSVAFGIFIDRASEPVNTPVIKNILNNGVVIYIGKISYGIYLIHNFIPYFYGLQIPFLSVSISIYVIQVLRFLIVIGLASLSWFLLEKPILRLKNRFEFNNSMSLKHKMAS